MHPGVLYIKLLSSVMANPERVRMYKAEQLVMLVLEAGGDEYNPTLFGNPLNADDVRFKATDNQWLYNDSHFVWLKHVGIVFLSSNDDKTLSMLVNRNFKKWDEEPKCPCSQDMLLPIQKESIWAIVLENDDEYEMAQKGECPRLDWNNIEKGGPGMWSLFSKAEWNVPFLTAQEAWPSLNAFVRQQKNKKERE